LNGFILLLPRVLFDFSIYYWCFLNILDALCFISYCSVTILFSKRTLS
jgi:hypothetical protein